MALAALCCAVLAAMGCGKKEEKNAAPSTPAAEATATATPNVTATPVASGMPTAASSTPIATPTPTPIATTSPVPAPTTSTLQTSQTIARPRPVLPPLPSPTVQARKEDASTTHAREGLFRIAARRESIDNRAALTALGEAAVNAHGLLNRLTAPENPEQVYAALQWCEFHGWPEEGSTVTLVRAACEKNENNRPLVAQLAASEAFAWPAPFDANSMMPNFVNIQTIGMLVLARARYTPNINAEEALRDVKTIMIWGRRMQGRNATVAAALNGVALRAHAVHMLGWMLQQRPAMPAKPGDLALFIAREQQLGKGAMQRAWEHQLSAAQTFMNRCLSILQRDLKQPELKKQFRVELEGKQLLPKEPIDDQALMDFVSTRTLQKFYRRQLEAGREFARRPASWRQAHRGEYATQAQRIYRPWAERLDPFPWPALDEALFQEDKLAAQANLLITALAVIAQPQDGQKKEGAAKGAADYLKAAGIDAAFAIEPFSGTPYKLEAKGKNKLAIHGPDRRALLFYGIPDIIIAKDWINRAQPIVVETRTE